ncbi:ribosome biogenesis GTPase Der [Mycoplasma iguanae]|uniref:GTPase Der n=1 Tax=Mycoplasma iguanae TaxID=292461 RepID=A0ABY5R7M7_9MOLU|nr:ribosome biogenesis GTPase Der [Mycoplasma iguanae]UVD81484.1 ribosome biogenesis GTPase Der [Mycoplasma iguanae]
MKNVVAIVGKPNVGKSTLFNKLIGKRLSIVHDMPGVTRDRIYQTVQWVGKQFEIIDTGGIQIENVPFQDHIKIQASIAIAEAEVIIFLVDGKKELDRDDYFIVDMLRKSGKKIIIGANKLENNIDFDPTLYSLGFDKIFSISAIHNEGLGDLLDEVVSHMNFNDEEKAEEFKLAIIGRPNAGKSTLLNSLLNENRAIVSPIAGTTRDSVTAFLEIDQLKYEIIDTAGINRKSRLIESVDHYALNRAIKSLDEADLSLIVIDATNQISHFDARLAGYAYERKKPIILIVNKWDLVQKETNTMVQYEKELRKNYKFLEWAPIIFISAINVQRLDKLRKKITDVRISLERKIRTSLLNEVIMDAQLMQPAPTLKGKKLKIYYIKQIEGKIPTFLLSVNNKDFAHFTYLRYIENQLRENFQFTGTPIELVLKNKHDK